MVALSYEVFYFLCFDKSNVGQAARLKKFVRRMLVQFDECSFSSVNGGDFPSFLPSEALFGANAGAREVERQ